MPEIIFCIEKTDVESIELKRVAGNEAGNFQTAQKLKSALVKTVLKE